MHCFVILPPELSKQMEQKKKERKKEKENLRPYPDSNRRPEAICQPMGDFYNFVLRHQWNNDTSR